MDEIRGSLTIINKALPDLPNYGPGIAGSDR
jgi:hypothetical protein